MQSCHQYRIKGCCRGSTTIPFSAFLGRGGVVQILRLGDIGFTEACRLYKIISDKVHFFSDSCRRGCVVEDTF